MKRRALIFGLILLILISSGCVEETQTKTTTPQPNVQDLEIIDISYQKFDTLFGVNSFFTNLEKDEKWGEYEGKIVKWKGQVVELNGNTNGGYTATFKHNPDTLAFDTLVDFDAAMKDKLMTISKGDYVTYIARLETKGGVLLTTLTLKGIDIES